MMEIDVLLVGRALLLLGIANGAPVLLARLLGRRLAAQIDGGRLWRDGRPVLGEGKTWRGLAAAICCTAPLAAWLGFGLATGAALAAAALLGDAASSFAKRRLGLPDHAPAPGLDQVPEALLPLLLLQSSLGLSLAEIAITLLAFIVLALALSRVLFRIGLRKRPY